MAGTAELKVTKATLVAFQKHIQQVLNEIHTQIRVHGTSTDTRGDTLIPVVDGALSVFAGGEHFSAATQLAAQVKAMGASVSTQLDWLDKLFTAMDFELTTTIKAFSDNEDFNSKLVQDFIADFPETVAAFGAPKTTNTEPQV
jgi:hypothetical protein